MERRLYKERKNIENEVRQRMRESKKRRGE